MSENNKPSVLDQGTEKAQLVQLFLAQYAAKFDQGADTRELYIDVIADVLHCLSQDLEADVEEYNDTWLDHITDVLDTAVGHYVEESQYEN